MDKYVEKQKGKNGVYSGQIKHSLLRDLGPFMAGNGEELLKVSE